ncbi:MAG: MFS transporter [Acidimicrobiales bacterium]
MTGQPSAARPGRPGLGGRFWTLWSAFAASNLGDGLTLVAFPLLAVAVTDDARLVALVTAFRFLPFLVVGLPAGVVLDRVGRQRMAVVAQAARLAAVVLLVAATATDRASITVLAVAAFVVGVGEVFTDGAVPALVRDVVDDDQLELANARLATAEPVTNMILGPPVGALLFELDPAAPFVAAAALFALSAGGLARLTGTYRPSPEDRLPVSLAEVTIGLRYVWAHPVLRPLAMAVALFSFVGAAIQAVLVILATERLGLGGLGFGVLLAAGAVGSILMSFGVAPFVRRAGHAASMRLAVVTFSLSYLTLGLTTSLGVAMVASAVAGVAAPAWNVVSSTVRQRLVPDEIFGRMMTAYLFLAWSMQPLGAALAGAVAERWGTQWVFVFAALAVGSLLVTGRPLFARLTEAMAGDPAR